MTSDDKVRAKVLLPFLIKVKITWNPLGFSYPDTVCAGAGRDLVFNIAIYDEV